MASALHVSVVNETSLHAAARLARSGPRVLVLSSASPIEPGGGFLKGTRGQEEALMRSSSLYGTLRGDDYYAAGRYDLAASDWAVLSPSVPVMRDDNGCLLEKPWLCSFLSVSPPAVKHLTKSEAARITFQRIARMVAIASACEFDTLVLGAWGCGSAGNDPAVIAAQFRYMLYGPYAGAFREIVFAIADRSANLKWRAPFEAEFLSSRKPVGGA
jgi:uncharacterized protein (TIGR02452 family)